MKELARSIMLIMKELSRGIVLITIFTQLTRSFADLSNLGIQWINFRDRKLNAGSCENPSSCVMSCVTLPYCQQ